MNQTPDLIPVTEKKPADRGERHSCSCGCSDAERPVMDARTIPHRLRHAAVIGAVSSITPGEAMELLAPHVPTPLLSQIDQLPGLTFQHTLLESGEGFARVEILRQA